MAPLTALMCVPCADSAAITDETAVFVPKQRVMVRMNPAMNSLSSRQRVLNGLRSTVTSDLMRIEDTQEWVCRAPLACSGRASVVRHVKPGVVVHGCVCTVCYCMYSLLESAETTNLALQCVVQLCVCC